MTKLSLTKILKEVRGTLGKTLTTFRVWKERQVLEDYPKPTYTRTSKQDEIRSWYKLGCEKWKTLTPEQKEAYKEKASKLGLTAFNVFMSEWLKSPKILFKYKVTIDNTQLNATLTNYQIKLVVSNDATFFNIFNNDHKYLEVYDSDKTTQLSFWVEVWDTTNKNAVIWIKVPSIPASSKKDIYLTYNQYRTTYLSSKDNTLDFYDDFNVDLSKWTQIQGTWALENDNLKSSTYDNDRIRTSTFTIKNARIRARASLKVSLSANRMGHIIRMTDANNYYYLQYSGDYNVIEFFKVINGAHTKIASYSITTDLNYHDYEMRFYESRFELLFDGISRIVTTDTAITSAGYIGYRKGGTGNYFYVDYVYVTKYAYPEPTVTYTKL